MKKISYKIIILIIKRYKYYQYIINNNKIQFKFNKKSKIIILLRKISKKKLKKNKNLNIMYKKLMTPKKIMMKIYFRCQKLKLIKILWITRTIQKRVFLIIICLYQIRTSIIK